MRGLARSVHQRQPVRPVPARTPLGGEEADLYKAAKQEEPQRNPRGPAQGPPFPMIHIWAPEG